MCTDYINNSFNIYILHNYAVANILKKNDSLSKYFFYNF